MILKIIVTFIISVVILINLIGGIKWIMEDFEGDTIVLVGLTQTLNVILAIVIQIIWS